MGMNEDVIENGPSRRRLGFRSIIGVALVGTVLAGAIYGVTRTGPEGLGTAQPTVAPSTANAAPSVPPPTKAAAEVADALLSEAIDSLPGKTGLARKNVLIIKGSRYVDGAETVIDE